MIDLENRFQTELCDRAKQIIETRPKYEEPRRPLTTHIHDGTGKLLIIFFHFRKQKNSKFFFCLVLFYLYYYAEFCIFVFVRGGGSHCGITAKVLDCGL